MSAAAPAKIDRAAYFKEWRRRRALGLPTQTGRTRGPEWEVRFITGRHPETGKPIYHYKHGFPTKSAAEDYMNAVLRGEKPETARVISQRELRTLKSLQAKADRFREKLVAAVQAGAKVEPGPPEL